MRVTELIQIEIDDVNLIMGFVKVFGKGNKERIIPLGDTVIEYLDTYINNVRPQLLKNGNECTVLNLHGRPLTRQGIWKLIKQYGLRANINKTLTPHIKTLVCYTFTRKWRRFTSSSGDVRSF